MLMGFTMKMFEFPQEETNLKLRFLFSWEPYMFAQITAIISLFFNPNALLTV